MLTYVILFLGTIYHCIKWQIHYRVKHKHDVVQFASLMVIGFAATLLLIAYMAYEDGGIRTRAILGAVVGGIAIDMFRNDYPSSGCATYMTAMAFFVTIRDLKLVYFYIGCLIMFSSGFLFTLQKQKIS